MERGVQWCWFFAPRGFAWDHAGSGWVVGGEESFKDTPARGKMGREKRKNNRPRIQFEREN
jgi:hypothetical protein